MEKYWGWHCCKKLLIEWVSKMKKFRIKKLCVLLITVIFLGTLNFNALAVSKTDNGSAASDNRMTQSVKYISESDARLLAEQCITEEKSLDEHCPWNNTTTCYETVQLYDYGSYVNSYLFRLMTNGVKKGYILVNANSRNPSVDAFGYDCDAMVDSMSLYYYGHRITNDEHIIYDSGLTFLKPNNASSVINMATNSVVNIDKKNTYQKYVDILKNNVNSKTVQNLSKLKGRMLQPSSKTAIMSESQTIYSDVVVPNLYANGRDGVGYHAYTTQNFEGKGNCAYTATVNFIEYWSQFSNINSSTQYDLWPAWYSAADVFQKLRYCINGSIDTGVYDRDAFNGLIAYGKLMGHPVAGDDIKEGLWATSWSWITQNIHNGNPLIFSVNLDSKYKDHDMLAVGYQECDNGDYLRICDGWNSTTSNFYKYSGMITGMWYVRW